MPTTPNLTLSVVLDGPHTVLQEPATWQELHLGEIAPQGQERKTGTVLVPGVGWRLATHRLWAEDIHELGVGSTLNLLPSLGLATVATASGAEWKERATQRALLEIPGISLGSQTTTGDIRLRKLVTTDATLHDSADAAAFPSPTVSEPVPLDRSLVSTSAYDPDDILTFVTDVPGNGGRTLGPIDRIIFSSIAGTSAADAVAGVHGTGEYALTRSGDGTARLEEWLSDGSWALRLNYNWCNRRQVCGFHHTLTIASDAVSDGDGNYTGTKILLNHYNQSTAGFVGSLIDATVGAVQAANGMAVGGTTTYRIPGQHSFLPYAERKIRIDIRRDLRMEMNAAIDLYVDSGTLRVQNFVLDGPCATGTVNLTAWGIFPTGTSVSIAVYGASSGTACTMSGAATGTRYSTAYFAPIAGERTYYAILTLSPRTDKRRSPTVNVVSLYRPAVTLDIERDPTVLTRVGYVSTTDGGSDPSTETLGVMCADPFGIENTRLALQSGMPISLVATGVDPDDPDATSTLFRGRVMMASKTQVAGRGGVGRTRTAARNAAFSRYSVRSVGPWAQLSKRLAPGRLDLAFGRDAPALAIGSPTTYKITDAIRALLTDGAGLPSSKVDVPDLPIRLPFDTGLPTFIEKFTPILPLALTLIRDYLGGYLLDDPNAGTSGMWRVLFCPKPPYVPVARFLYAPDVAGVPMEDPRAYSNYVRPSDSVEIPSTFLRFHRGEGGKTTWVEPPQYNQIRVRGLAVIKPSTFLTASASRSGDVGAYDVILNNWTAALFDSATQGTMGGPPAPDPDDPDYTDGEVNTLYHADPMLTTPEAVLFVARRLFDLKCHAKTRATGEGPVVFVSPSVTGDAMQTKYRKLRFGDPVIFPDDSIWLVMSCNLLTTGEQGGQRKVQAFYEFLKAPEVDTYRGLYGDGD